LARKKELEEIFNKAIYDREKAEIIASKESSLLNVLKGEVLRNPRYARVFNF
jgi:hypothetical protein